MRVTGDWQPQWSRCWKVRPLQTVSCTTFDIYTQIHIHTQILGHTADNCAEPNLCLYEYVRLYTRIYHSSSAWHPLALRGMRSANMANSIRLCCRSLPLHMLIFMAALLTAVGWLIVGAESVCTPCMPKERKLFTRLLQPSIHKRSKISPHNAGCIEMWTRAKEWKSKSFHYAVARCDCVHVWVLTCAFFFLMCSMVNFQDSNFPFSRLFRRLCFLHLDFFFFVFCSWCSEFCCVHINAFTYLCI